MFNSYLFRKSWNYKKVRKESGYKHVLSYVKFERDATVHSWEIHISVMKNVNCSLGSRLVAILEEMLELRRLQFNAQLRYVQYSKNRVSKAQLPCRTAVIFAVDV